MEFTKKTKITESKNRERRKYGGSKEKSISKQMYHQTETVKLDREDKQREETKKNITKKRTKLDPQQVRRRGEYCNKKSWPN